MVFLPQLEGLEPVILTYIGARTATTGDHVPGCSLVPTYTNRHKPGASHGKKEGRVVLQPRP